MVWLLVCLLAATPAAAIDIEPWTLEHLDLDVHIELDPPRLTINGTATVRAAAESDGIAFGINGREKVMVFRSLRSGGRESTIHPFADDPDIEVAELSLPAAVPAGTTVEVEFAAESNASSSQFLLSEKAVYASWVETWYPRPALAEHELASPAAAGRTTIRMPAAWRSIAPGKLQSRREEGGEAIEVWETESPAARSFVAAPFVAHETASHDVGILLLKQRPAIRNQAEVLAKAVAAMEERFGPYPYPSFHIVELPEEVKFAAASEQGFVAVRSSLLDAEEGNLPLFAHEAAHAWWGNLVRTDGPGGKNLSEAASQYGAVLSIEALEGVEAARRFLRYSRAGYSPLQCAVGYFHIWRQGGDKPLAKLESDRWDHDLADSKGHWFYHMTRARLGDDAFFKALRSILREFAGKQATVADLRRAFLAVSDDPALPHFLEQWLDRGGAPILDVDWWSMDRGRSVEIHIQQLQPGEPFQLPLEIAIDLDGGGILRTTVDLSDRQNRFKIATAARPVGVRLDPDDRMLLWRPEYGPRPDPAPSGSTPASRP
jgi:aminopeptidase N